MYLTDMCESSSKDTVVAVLSHIGFSAVLHNTVVDNACDVHQSRLDSISWSYYKYSITWSIQQPGVITIALPMWSSQGTSFNKFTFYPFFNQFSSQGKGKVSLHPISSEYQGNDVDEEVKLLSEELHHVNTEIDLTDGEEVKDQGEAMSTSKHNLVAVLINKNSPVLNTSGQLPSYSLSHVIKVAHQLQPWS